MKKVNDMPDLRYYAAPENKLVNKDKCAMIRYEESYGMVIPICPFCKEPAYENDYCVFCGATFMQPPKKIQDKVRELNGEIRVSYKTISLQQIAGACYAYENGVLISISEGVNVSKEKLLERAKIIYKNRSKCNES